MEFQSIVKGTKSTQKMRIEKRGYGRTNVAVVESDGM